MQEKSVLFSSVTIPSGAMRDVRIVNGVITEVVDSDVLQPRQDERHVKKQGLLLLPGAIDPHGHFRGTPAEFHKEDYGSLGRAAIMNGICTVAAMPNPVDKPITSLANLDWHRRAAQDQGCKARVVFVFGSTPTNEDESLQALKQADVPGLKMFMGSSTGDLLIKDPKVQRQRIVAMAKTGRVTCVHAEDDDLIGANMQRFHLEVSRSDPEAHGFVRMPPVEIAAVQRVLGFVREVSDARVHFCHISTPEALRAIEEMRGYVGARVTVEVTPHHLLLDERSIRDRARDKSVDYAAMELKVNPPLRTGGQRRQLRNALISRPWMVDAFASDHAPHTLAEKRRPYIAAKAGLPGMGMTLRLALDMFWGKWDRVVDLTHNGPARILGIEPTAIAPGNRADIAVIDTLRYTVLTAARLGSKCGWTPYEGMRMRGEVVATLRDGVFLYEAFDDP